MGARVLKKHALNFLNVAPPILSPALLRRHAHAHPPLCAAVVHIICVPAAAPFPQATAPSPHPFVARAA